jgi:3'(2'), 5'-bisphosphate nucleotidase
MTEPDHALLAEIERLARAAGDTVLDVYRAPFDVASKIDGSPVTEADRRAEDLIVAGLARLVPGIPVVAEEAASRGDLPVSGARFWLVDPLDGTREFVARNGEFTVNIAFIEGGEPALGVVFAPAIGRLYAAATGLGAFVDDGGGRRAIRARRAPASALVAAVSRSHGGGGRLDAYLAAQGVARRIVAGSSLKFGLLAAGEADLYPRFGRTMEWDTAAGQAVLVAAGGRVLDLAGAPLRYGKPGYANPDFVATGAA